MSNTNQELILNLKNINSFCTDKNDNFSKADKANYFEALTDLSKNLQKRLITICNHTGSAAKIFLGSHDYGHSEDEVCYVWSEPLLYIDDAIFHIASPSFYNFAEEHLFHLSEEFKEIIQDLNIFGYHCLQGQYNIIDKVEMIIDRENIEFTASFQLRENITQTVKV